MVLTAYGARPRRSLARCVSIVAKRDASVEASGTHAFAVRKARRSSFGTAHVHRIPTQRFVTTAKRPFIGRDGANF
jgi:hypothetical protein